MNQGVVVLIDNRFGTSTHDREMDGFRAVLECVVYVVAGEPVIVTFVFADGGDGTVDETEVVFLGDERRVANLDGIKPS